MNCVSSLMLLFLTTATGELPVLQVESNDSHDRPLERFVDNGSVLTSFELMDLNQEVSPLEREPEEIRPEQSLFETIEERCSAPEAMDLALEAFSQGTEQEDTDPEDFLLETVEEQSLKLEHFDCPSGSHPQQDFILETSPPE